MSTLDFKTKQISELKDPFDKDCIEVVHFHCYNSTMWGPPSFSATIKFKNGNTKGEQKVEAESFAVLVQKVDDFIKSL